MSASAWGKLFIGWKFKDEPLRVPDGKHYECPSYSHDLNGSTAYCPRCGGRVREVDTMVPSPLVHHFAERRGVSVEKALGILEPYQHQLPQHWSDSNSGGWLLGIEVAKVGSNQWKKVTPEMPSEIRDLLIGAGMPVGGDDLYMAVWLS